MELQLQTKDPLAALHLDPRTKLYLLIVGNVALFLVPSLLKVAFASIYAMSPEIYLLDEPSSNLDIDATRDLRRILELLKKQGKTILITEHRIYYLRESVDRIVYMENGAVSAVFSPYQFLSIIPIRFLAARSSARLWQSVWYAAKTF